MTSESNPPRRWMIAIALVFLAHVLYLNGVAEDAFIALRFARNLAHGHGLVWNPGTPPVEGYTDFLWVIAAAGGNGDWTARRRVRTGAVGCIGPGDPGAHLCRRATAHAVAAGCRARAVRAARGLRSVRDVVLERHGVDAVRLLRPARGVSVRASSGASNSDQAAVVGALALLLATLTRPEGMIIALLLFGVNGLAALWFARNRLVAARAGGSWLISLPFGVYFCVALLALRLPAAEHLLRQDRRRHPADPARRPARVSLHHAVRSSARTGSARGRLGSRRAAAREAAGAAVRRLVHALELHRLLDRDRHRLHGQQRPRRRRLHGDAPVLRPGAAVHVPAVRVDRRRALQPGVAAGQLVRAVGARRLHRAGDVLPVDRCSSDRSSTRRRSSMATTAACRSSAGTSPGCR